MNNKQINNKKEPTLIVLVGLPGAGKSTFGKNLENAVTKYFSSDAIRRELFDDETEQRDPNSVFTLMRSRTVQALRDGYDVIYDATNITRKNRASILNSVPKGTKKKCVIVWAPIEVCIERDSKRERTVGQDVIDKMLRRFQAPFYDEGFDEIEIVNTAEFNSDGFNSDEYTRKQMATLDILHDNPHHTTGVLEHCISCGNYLMQQKELPLELVFAGYIHDIGKPYTKTFVNTRGETTEVAHYYDHQAVGSYISYGLTGSSELVAWLVSTHMAPFINQKYYNTLTGDYKAWIDILHEADKNAH